MIEWILGGGAIIIILLILYYTMGAAGITVFGQIWPKRCRGDPPNEHCPGGWSCEDGHWYCNM